MKTIVSTDNAPEPVGPYSQGTAFENLVFISGQIPLVPGAKDVVSQDISDQTRQVMENIKALLESEKSGLDQILIATLYIKNMDDFSTINTVYGTFFKNAPPARATVEVSRLPRDVQIEISVIAHK